MLSGRKKAKRRERITEPAPNRNGAPDTMGVCENKNKILIEIMSMSNLSISQSKSMNQSELAQAQRSLGELEYSFRNQPTDKTILNPL